MSPDPDDMSGSKSGGPAVVDLDTTGLRCPMPVIRTESALRKLPDGHCLRVLADDPVARVDIPHFCRAAGHRVQEIDLEGEIVTFLITPSPGDAAR